MTAYAIQTCRIGKRYDRGVLAVDQVSLAVRPGEIYGFLGLNGAGKSTVIRMLLGMIAPTSGHAEIFGQRVGSGTTEIWRRVGYLVDTATAYPELTVRENLEAGRRLYQVPDRAAVERTIDALSLTPYADRRARTLSLGNLQRLALARAMLHRPELLILDEPTNALDPAGVVEIRELLRRLSRENGVTVLMSSHVLAEVERVATRVGILHRGRLVEELDAAKLEQQRERRLEVGARDLERAIAALVDAGFAPRKGPTHIDGAPVLELREARAIDDPGEVASVLVSRGTPPTRLAVVQENLETRFLHVTHDAPGATP